MSKDSEINEILETIYTNLKDDLLSIEKEVLESLTKEAIGTDIKEIVKKYEVDLENLINTNMKKIKSRAIPTEYVDLNSKESSEVYPNRFISWK